MGRRCAGNEALRSCGIPNSELWTSPASPAARQSLQGFPARACSASHRPPAIMQTLVVLLVAVLACQPALGEPWPGLWARQQRLLAPARSLCRCSVLLCLHTDQSTR